MERPASPNCGRGRIGGTGWNRFDGTSDTGKSYTKKYGCKNLDVFPRGPFGNQTWLAGKRPNSTEVLIGRSCRKWKMFHCYGLFYYRGHKSQSADFRDRPGQADEKLLISIASVARHGDDGAWFAGALRCWPSKPNAQEIEDKVQAMCRPWSSRRSAATGMCTCRHLKTENTPRFHGSWFMMIWYLPFK